MYDQRARDMAVVVNVWHCLERSSIGVCSHAPRAVVHQRFVEVAENSVDASRDEIFLWSV